MNFVAWLRRLLPQPPPVSPRRPRPPGWNKTVADLLASRQAKITSDEIEWARDYEREQLRPWARFPRDGEVFEATRDVEVEFVTHWSAPYTGGGTGRMPAGRRLRVQVDEGDREPVGVYATPLDDGQLERELVPEADRAAAKYAGFSLFVPVRQLNEEFRRVG